MPKKIIIFLSLFFTLPIYSSMQELWTSWTSWLSKRHTDTVIKQYDITPNATITLNVYGNVILKSHTQKQLFIEMEGSDDDLNDTVLHAEIKSSQALITTHSKSNTENMLNYICIVPTTASVTLITKKGHLTVDGIEGTLSALTENGDIIINNGISTITAKAPHGKINAQQKKLPTTASLFFEAGKGINLALNRMINAHLHAKTIHGSIESILNVTLDPIKTFLNKNAWKKMMQDVKATLGSGGAPITLDVTKGNIVIEEL